MENSTKISIFLILESYLFDLITGEIWNLNRITQTYNDLTISPGIYNLFLKEFSFMSNFFCDNNLFLNLNMLVLFII